MSSADSESFSVPSTPMSGKMSLRSDIAVETWSDISEPEGRDDGDNAAPIIEGPEGSPSTDVSSHSAFGMEEEALVTFIVRPIIHFALLAEPFLTLICHRLKTRSSGYIRTSSSATLHASENYGARIRDPCPSHS